MASTETYEEECGDGACSCNEEQGEPDGADIFEADSGSACDNHDVETSAANAIEHVVVDIFALHDFDALEDVECILYEYAKEGSPKEVESPNEGFDGLGAEVAEVGMLDAPHEGKDEGVDEEH